MIDGLIINRDSIPSEGLRRVLELDPVDLDLKIDNLSGSAINFSGLLKLDMDIKIAANELIIRFKIEYTLKLICSRCLDEFKLIFDKSSILNYNIQNSDSADISESLREEIILDYPQKPLCKEDCAGICLTCKVNLNREDCKCSK